MKIQFLEFLNHSKGSLISVLSNKTHLRSFSQALGNENQIMKKQKLEVGTSATHHPYPEVTLDNFGFLVGGHLAAW